jgi:nucleoside-diphosphate-sugar epimerase
MNKLSKETVMITGATGFLGSHLCRRLQQLGAQMHAVSRIPRAAADDIRWWQGEMGDVMSVRDLFREIKPDLVFHLSGLGKATPDVELVLPTLHSLLVSTVNILVAASEFGCRRVVLAASLTEPQPNGSEITPGSPYAAAKWTSGAYARMFHRLYGLPVIMVRPFMTYGPRQNEEKVIPHVIRSLLARQAPKLSSGQQPFDWIYIDDVIDGFLAAAVAPRVDGDTIDLGSGILVPIRAVVDQLVDLIGVDVKPLFGGVADRPCEPVRVADVNDAYAKLGWKPRTRLRDGLKQTVDWYKQ